MAGGEGEVLVGAASAGAGGRQRGAVLALGGGQEGRQYEVPGDLAWLATGQQDFEHFGSSIAVSEDQLLVAVGSPAYRVAANADDSFSPDDVEMAGKVSVFSRADGEVSLLHQETGVGQSSSLGASLAFVSAVVEGERGEYLAVGQPASNSSSSDSHVQTGSVLLRQRDQNNISLTISGNMEVGRFGLTLARGWDGGLLVSAPYAGLGLSNHGKVYHYSASSSLPSDDVTSHCVSRPAPCTEEWSDLLLVGQQEEESLFGSALSWSRAGDGSLTLAVAAERSSLGSRMGGAVLLYNIPDQ